MDKYLKLCHITSPTKRSSKVGLFVLDQPPNYKQVDDDDDSVEHIQRRQQMKSNQVDIIFNI